MEVSLTHSGLSRLTFNNDFKLKTDVSEDSIKCSRSQISFISPAISRLLLNDPTINEFKLKTPNSSKCSELLRSLLNGNKITVTGDLLGTFVSISLELGNNELLSHVEEDLTLENALGIVHIKSQRSQNVAREIEFIASHFNEFDPVDVSFLDIDIIDSILSSHSLVLSSEHSLFDFICDLISNKGDEYRSLLGNIRIEFLGQDDISQFIEFIDETNIGSILPCIFRHLIASQKPPIIVDDITRYKRIKASHFGKMFEGIFYQLWQKHGGHPVTKNIISIEETSGTSQSMVPNIIDPRKRMQTNWFCRSMYLNGYGSFIFDFKDKKVSLTGYSLTLLIMDTQHF